VSPEGAGTADVRTSGRKLAVMTAVISMIAGLGSLVLFLIASYGALSGDQSVFRQRIAEGFQYRQLVEDPFQEGSTTIGSHQWNDCLIIVMAMDKRGDRNRLAIAPILMGFDQGGPSLTTNPCAVLSALNKGARPNAELYYYDRYFHGAVVLLRYLVPHKSISDIRRLYRQAITTGLLLSLALVMIGLWRGENLRAFAVLGVTTIALMRYFGLESYSQSLGHGPADAVIAIYLLGLCLMAFAPPGLVVALVAAVLFGTLTMIFELFTGGVPIGLAMVIGLTPLVTRPAVRPAFTAMAAAAAFLGAGAIMYAARMVLIAMAGTTQVGRDVVSEVMRLTIFSREGAHLGVAVHNFVDSIGVLAGGMRLLSAGTIALALAAGAFGLLRIWSRDRSSSREREEAALLGVSAAIPPLWCFFFSFLMINHAWFTDRVMVWPIAAGFGIFLMALTMKASPAGRLPGALASPS
jgi:hypothetical protein